MRLSNTVLTLLLPLLLIAGCGGGSDSSENVIVNPPEPSQDGIQGRASSKIRGALLTVHDANGEEIVLASGRTTNATGAYSLVFSEFAIDDDIVAPLMVTLNGEGATAVCDFDDEGDNDCLSRDGTFVTFGETYDLADNFQLRGLAASFPPETNAGDRKITVNISAASDLAAQYATDQAAGSPLVPSYINLASQQALGVVEFVTGLSTAGKSLNDIPIIDLTLAEPQAADSMAVAFFSASLHDQIDTEIIGLSDYRRILDRLPTNIQPTPGSNTDQLQATGNFLAGNLQGFTKVASSFKDSLANPSAVLSGAVSAQTIAVPLLQEAGNSPVAIALPADPSSDTPLDNRKLFATRLSEVMGSTLIISPSGSFAGTASGANAVYSEQISLLATLVSQEVRNTTIQLDDAIAEALLNDETELTGTNVSGALSFEGDIATMTTATSTTSNIQTGISVNVTIPTCTRNNPGGEGTFNAAEITISVSQTQNDLTTQELFVGILTLQMIASGSSADADELSYEGSFRSVTGLEFSGNTVVANLAPAEEPLPRGDYDAEFNFDDNSRLTMTGAIDAQVETYSINSGSNTVVTDLLTNTITDMNASLNLSLDVNDAVAGGTLQSNDVTTGTLDSSGVLEFTDNTVSVLPARII